MTGILKTMISANTVASTSYTSNTALVLINGNSSLIKDISTTTIHIYIGVFLENSIVETLFSLNVELKGCFSIAVAIHAPPKLGSLTQGFYLINRNLFPSTV